MQNPQTCMFRLLGKFGSAGLLKQCNKTQELVNLQHGILVCAVSSAQQQCIAIARKRFQKQDACVIACLMVCALEAPSQHMHKSKPCQSLVAH